MIRSGPNPVRHPLFPTSALLPLSEPGGVMYALEHTPAALRPYSATLGVPMPLKGKKHDTATTRPPTSQPTQRSHDGHVVPDTIPDTGSDS